MPPAVLTNADLSTFLDTDDEWITTRTGMRERRISHVSAIEMASVAARRALACAGLDAADVDLIVYGSCSSDEQVPNSASGVQAAIAATRAAAIDLNTACTSFLYGLSAAGAMIATGAVNRALVIGVELISPYMDWDNRNVAVLFGDGCAAVVLQRTEGDEGLLGQELGCDAEGRASLRVRGMGCVYANRGIVFGDTQWDFDGQDIFRRAVAAMVQASVAVLAAQGRLAAEVDLLIPHQANLRIIEAVATRLDIPHERAFVNVQRYGNMSAATIPVAMVEALEEGRVAPGGLLLLPAFGAGLTWCAHLVRWGERVAPLADSDAGLPPASHSGLELVQALMRRRERASA